MEDFMNSKLITDTEAFLNTIESIKILCKLYNMPTIASDGTPAVNVYLDKLVELYNNK